VALALHSSSNRRNAVEEAALIVVEEGTSRIPMVDLVKRVCGSLVLLSVLRLRTPAFLALIPFMLYKLNDVSWRHQNLAHNNRTTDQDVRLCFSRLAGKLEWIATLASSTRLARVWLLDYVVYS
jgi:hypothetical protein